jgi:hypothetical protein
MVLTPVILLGIVGTLCFVGCILPEYDYVEDFTAYTGKTILPTKTLIGYWPLKETKDTDAAVDLASVNNGKYIDPNTADPGIYPWPKYSVPNGSNPDVLSAAGIGDIKLGEKGIVLGDIDLLPDDPVAPACMVVNGCYVEVPWNDKFIPKISFTLEAWVRVDWTATDPHAFRFVVDSREISPAAAGFGLCAKAVDDQPGVYQWNGILGDGSSTFVILDSVEAPFTLKDSASAAGVTYYLVLTYDGPSHTLTLYVNGDLNVQATAVAYAPNMTQPLWIGAGAPYVMRRTDPAPTVPTSPLFPFVGAIQDVAIYSEALGVTEIARHFANGNKKEYPLLP